MPTDLVEAVYRALRSEIGALEARVQRQLDQGERAETAGGVPSYTLATAPSGAGMSSGTNHLDIAFIRDGRKPGEGAGLGTGVLAYWNGSAWIRASDYTPVVT